MSYNRRSTILDLRDEGVLKLWHDYRFGHALDFSGNNNHGTINSTANTQHFTRQGLEFSAGCNGLLTPSIDLTGTQAVSFVIGLRSIETRGVSSRVFLELSPTFTAVTTGFALLETGGAFNIRVAGDVGNSYVSLPGGNVPAGVLGYLGGTMDKSEGSGDEVRGFIDGEFASTVTSSANNTNAFGNHVLYVGARNVNSLLSSSLIQGVILTSRALTDDEHRAVYKELAYP